MNLEKRNTFLFKFKEPKIESPKVLCYKLTTINRNNFISDYGNFLELLTEKTDPEVVINLAQFYDPPLWCFTFSDFQLAPNLEEFERILGHTLKEHNLFAKLGDVPIIERTSLALGLDIKDVALNLETKGSLKGFSKKFIESQAITLKKDKNWKVFSSILALLVYRISLFPNIENFVDYLEI